MYPNNNPRSRAEANDSSTGNPLAPPWLPGPGLPDPRRGYAGSLQETWDNERLRYSAASDPGYGQPNNGYGHGFSTDPPIFQHPTLRTFSFDGHNLSSAGVAAGGQAGPFESGFQNSSSRVPITPGATIAPSDLSNGFINGSRVDDTLPVCCPKHSPKFLSILIFLAQQIATASTANLSAPSVSYAPLQQAVSPQNLRSQVGGSALPGGTVGRTFSSINFDEFAITTPSTRLHNFASIGNHRISVPESKR